MSSDEGMGTFVAARLDEEETRANAMEHFIVYDDTYYSCPATRTEPHGDLEWGEEHCQCGLAGRKAKRLREIAAGRALVTFAFENASQIDGEWGDGHEAAEIAAGQCADHGLKAAKKVLGPLAAIWNDHPEYRDWKP